MALQFGFFQDLRIPVEFGMRPYPAEAQEQVPASLQRLLVERFGLASHTESRRIDAYELTVGKEGLKIPEVEAVNDLEKDFTKGSSGASASDSVNETTRDCVASIDSRWKSIGLQWP